MPRKSSHCSDIVNTGNTYVRHDDDQINGIKQDLLLLPLHLLRHSCFSKLSHPRLIAAHHRPISSYENLLRLLETQQPIRLAFSYLCLLSLILSSLFNRDCCRSHCSSWCGIQEGDDARTESFDCAGYTDWLKRGKGKYVGVKGGEESREGGRGRRWSERFGR